MARLKYYRVRAMPPVIRKLIRLIAVAASLITVSLRANEPVAPPRDAHSEYVVDCWQTEHGLPDDFTTALAQTPEGYLWIATFNGLTRFNGTEFKTFDADNTPELPSSRVGKLNVDRAGRLWIKSELGALSWWWNGRFKKFTFENGQPVRAERICQDAAGEVWIERADSPTNYFHLVGDHLEPVASPEPFLARFGEIMDSQGHGWSVISNSLSCLDPAHPLVTPIPGFRGYGYRMLASRDGGVWIVANRFQKFRQGEWLDFGPTPIETDQFNDYVEDRNGALWIGTDTGELWRVGTNGFVGRFTFPGVTMPQVGRTLLEDAEGNLWVGTGGSGLFRLKPRVFRNYNSHDGLASDLVRSVTQDRAGNIWFASVNRVDWIPHGGGSIQACETLIQLPWEVIPCPQGGVWVGSWNQGLFHVPGGNGPVLHYPPTEGHHTPINAMFLRRSGQVELGTPLGLMELVQDCPVTVPPPPGIGNMDVRAMAEDSQGGLYLGLDNLGLFRKNRDAWQHFSTANGLASDRVRALYVDAEDVVWIGTQGGLSRFDGKAFFNYSGRTGQGNEALDLPRAIIAILQDDEGSLWLASPRGLYRVSKAQLNRVAQGLQATADVVHYDHADGMGSSQCTGDHQPSAWKMQDGSLWFATMNGIAVIDPKSLPFDARPPSLVIEGLYADDSPAPLSANEAGELQAPAGTSRLEFRYAALTLSAPEKARFRYQLENFDKDWISAGTRRIADYTKAPPGHYRFHVIAANHDNVWNYQGAFVDVRVLPLYWQTGWFRAAVMLLLAGAGLGAYHWRVRHLHAQRLMQESFSRQLLQSQELERKRMAAELHDSLGQNLLVLNNHATFGIKEVDQAGKIRERLGKIRDSAWACIEEVRSIARSLRPYQLDRFGLSKTLEDIGDLLADTTGLEVTTEIENLDGTFAPEVEISIYRIAQEWLNNVVKHAHASRARLVARRESGRARLVLEDNGVGFDYAAVIARPGPDQSFGLVNMRERVRLLGGTVQLETAEGKGTRWIIEIPYATTPYQNPDR